MTAHIHTAQGVNADAMHGVVTGEETRQVLYAMMTRGRAETHTHVLKDDLGNDREFELPGITEHAAARSPSRPKPLASRRQDGKWPVCPLSSFDCGMPYRA